MSAATILTMASGHAVDLTRPTPDDIDFHDAAEQLAKEPRFNGATPGIVYSVAQHLVIGGEAVWAGTGNRAAVAYFLAHDIHEHALKDDTTPKKRALAAIAEERFGVLAQAIMGAFAELTDRWDVAIHAAAGLPWPPPPEIAEIVHHFDRVMLVTEWRDLMRGEMPAPPAGVEPLFRPLAPWHWHEAARRLLLAWRDHFPNLGGNAG